MISDREELIRTVMDGLEIMSTWVDDIELMKKIDDKIQEILYTRFYPAMSKQGFGKAD